MKRKLLLIGVPVIVLAAWAFSSVNTSQGDAEVDISAQHPTQLRDSAVAAVNAAGGTRISEDTKFDDGEASELEFEVPTARIEEATRALSGLGGHVTDQRVDLSAAADAAASVNQKLTDARDCVDRLPAAVSSVAARSQLSQCRTQLANVAGQIGTSKVNLTTSVLVVKITPISTFNPALLVAIILLIVAAVGMGILVWRSDRFRPTVDMRDLAEYESVDGDLHLRRN